MSTIANDYLGYFNQFILISQQIEKLQNEIKNQNLQGEFTTQFLTIEAEFKQTCSLLSDFSKYKLNFVIGNLQKAIDHLHKTLMDNVKVGVQNNAPVIIPHKEIVDQVKDDQPSTHCSTGTLNTCPNHSLSLVEKHKKPEMIRDCTSAKKFSGQILDWPFYYSMICENVVNTSLTTNRKYYLIWSSLPRNAQTLISHIPLTDPQCIEKILSILIQRYDLSTFPSDDIQ